LLIGKGRILLDGNLAELKRRWSARRAIADASVSGVTAEAMVAALYEEYRI